MDGTKHAMMQTPVKSDKQLELKRKAKTDETLDKNKKPASGALVDGTVTSTAATDALVDAASALTNATNGDGVPTDIEVNKESETTSTKAHTLADTIAPLALGKVSSALATAALENATSVDGVTSTVIVAPDETVDLGTVEIRTGYRLCKFETGSAAKCVAYMELNVAGKYAANKVQAQIQSMLPPKFTSGTEAKTLLEMPVVVNAKEDGNVIVLVECPAIPEFALRNMNYYARKISGNVIEDNAGNRQLDKIASAGGILIVAFQKQRNGPNAQNKFMVRMFEQGITKLLGKVSTVSYERRFFYPSKEEENARYGGLSHRRYVCAEESDADAVIDDYRRAGIYLTEYSGATKAAAPAPARVYGSLGAPPADLF